MSFPNHNGGKILQELFITTRNELAITGGNRISLLSLIKPIIPYLPESLDLKLSSDGQFIWIGNNTEDKIPVPGSSASSVQIQESYTITDNTPVSQLSFSGNVNQNKTKQVFLNGYLLRETVDYTLDYSGKKINFVTSIEKTVGGTANIIIDFYYYL